ncbi:hypothetical protein ABK040_001881 [Willaertia magna]
MKALRLKGISSFLKFGIKQSIPSKQFTSLLSSSSFKHFSQSLYFKNHECCNNSSCDNKEEQIEIATMPGEYKITEEEKIEKSAKMGLFYTCGKCKRRHYIEFSKHSYNKGVVVTRCSNCNQLHLIADNLGYFNKGKNLEEIYGNVVKQSDLANKVTENSIK